VGRIHGAHRRRGCRQNSGNDEWFAQYQAGTLDPVEYLEFALGNLARFPREQLDEMHLQFMDEVVKPAILPQAWPW
jgi:hypothetical protein